MIISVAILTASDRAKEGVYEDESGPMLTEIILTHTDWQVIAREVVRDEIEDIRAILSEWCSQGINLIFTTGGTGFSPRDRTPEATKLVIERETPGISEKLRQESSKVTPYAMLSRGISGIAGKTLIINLPGSPKAVKENMGILLPVLPHAMELLLGNRPNAHDPVSK